MDDYCWIHSTFHVRNEFQGNVGCILDQVLAGRDSILLAAADTPDTAFYQWVPFTLCFQVSSPKVYCLDKSGFSNLKDFLKVFQNFAKLFRDIFKSRFGHLLFNFVILKSLLNKVA